MNRNVLYVRYVAVSKQKLNVSNLDFWGVILYHGNFKRNIVGNFY